MLRSNSEKAEDILRAVEVHWPYYLIPDTHKVAIRKVVKQKLDQYEREYQELLNGVDCVSY